jgi:hypothetical protein
VHDIRRRIEEKKGGRRGDRKGKRSEDRRRA